LNLRLSPVGVLRVAAWPVEALDAFGDRELFAAGAALGERAPTTTLERVYEAVLVQEREALWARTVSDERFRKALALANPALYEKLEGRAARPDARPNKRARHLDTTLYRLLARAVGRTEPFGAWCGVGIVTFGETTRFRRVTPARFVAPDLGFFAAALEVLRLRDDVRRTARFRLNPTLGRQSDGSWAYWSPPPDTARGRGTVAPYPVLDGALERLGALGLFTLPDAERALDVAPHTLDAFVFEQLLPQGLVVGGPALPPFFSDPWDALRQIASSLPDAAVEPFRRLTGELAEVCQRIEDAFDSAPAAEIAALGAAAREAGARFAAAIGAPALPPLGLFLDSGAPFELTIGPDVRAALAAEIARTEADTSGPLRAHNERFRRALCALVGAGGLPLAALPASTIAGATAAATWPVVPAAEYFPEWPLRTALASLGGGLLGASAMELTDDATAAIARFVPCLEKQAPEATRELVAWLCQAHAAAGRMAALGEPSAGVPNAAAQPDLGLPRRSLWGAVPDHEALSGARVVALEGRGLVAVEQRGEVFALAPLPALNLGVGDPVLGLLLASSMRFPPPPPEAAAPSPRAIELPADPRGGVHRWIAWCRAAAGHSGHVMVHRPGAAPLRVPVESPLAVSALLEGARGAAVLEPVGDAPFVADDSGHYVAQLVLPFGPPASESTK
jgi:hypothetical protein